MRIRTVGSAGPALARRIARISILVAAGLAGFAQSYAPAQSSAPGKTGTQEPAATQAPAPANPAPTAVSPDPAAAIPTPPPTRKGPTTPNASPENPDPYVIGSLDVLSISVWGVPNFNHLYDVRRDGMMSVPLIGEIKADGLTVEQLKDTLKTKLGEYITNPEIDIQVTKINSKQYFITGEVTRTGAFPLLQPTSVMEALINAGGLRDFAKKKKIYVLRGSQRFNFNYDDVSKGRHMEQDIQLRNGDKIFVP